MGKLSKASQESHQKYAQSRKGKDAQKRYLQSEKGKANQKRYTQSEKGRKTRKERDAQTPMTEERRVYLRRYAKTEKAKARFRRYWTSVKGRLAKHRKNAIYKRTELGKAAVKRSTIHRQSNLRIVINTLTAAEWIEIQKEFHHRCAYCRKKIERLTMDHVIPLSKGGNHTKENVLPACRSCNAKKGNKLNYQAAISALSGQFHLPPHPGSTAPAAARSTRAKSGRRLSR